MLASDHVSVQLCAVLDNVLLVLQFSYKHHMGFSAPVCCKYYAEASSPLLPARFSPLPACSRAWQCRHVLGKWRCSPGSTCTSTRLREESAREIPPTRANLTSLLEQVQMYRYWHLHRYWLMVALPLPLPATIIQASLEH